jgi:two-component system, cell cycle response regulator
MSAAPFSVALLGFTAFEYGAFEAFFKMVAVSRPPGYRAQTDIQAAELIIVNADNAAVISQMIRSGPVNRPVLLIGHSDAGTGWPLLPRPIRLTNVLATLNRLAIEQKAPPVTPSAPVTMSPAIAAPVVAAPPPQAPRDIAPYLLSPAEDHTALTTFDDADDVLVVDDSDVALKFMEGRLQSFGFRVHLARSGEECIMMLGKHNFRCVFLDVMMSGLDGYQTCRVIKQRKYETRRAPTVVMMTSKGGPFDKVRGAMAGCDGYLVKPLDEAKLIKVLFHHKVSTSQKTSINLQERLSQMK